MKRKKPIERICNNCKLYNPQEGHCSVVVLWEGRRAHIPVSPGDPCFYESLDVEVPGAGFVQDLKEVKFWVENQNGERTGGDGVVKMEYPEGFFDD